MERNVTIIQDLEGKKIVLINDIRFKGKEKEEWKQVEEYLKEYVGRCYEIAETSEKVYIGSDFPDEYTHGKDKTILKGSNAKAKANASQAVGELIQIATNQQLQIMVFSIWTKQNWAGIGTILGLHFRCIITKES